VSSRELPAFQSQPEGGGNSGGYRDARGHSGAQLCPADFLVLDQFLQAKNSDRQQSQGPGHYPRIVSPVANRPADMKSGISNVADVEGGQRYSDTGAAQRCQRKAPAETDVDQETGSAVDRELRVVAAKDRPVDPGQETSRPDPFFSLVGEQNGEWPQRRVLD